MSAERAEAERPSREVKGKIAVTDERGAKPALAAPGKARNRDKSAGASTDRAEGGRRMAGAGQDEVLPATSKAKEKVTSTSAASGPVAAAASLTASTRAEERPASEVSSSPEAPRAGSKQALLVGMLSAEQGATIEALIAATGWLPHTTRAVLTGLRKRGYAIELSRADDRGPSVYRIASRVATGVSVGA